MLQKIIDHVAQGFERCFDGPQIEQMARNSKFVQRKSKLTGSVFVKALVFGCIQYPQATLRQLCQIIADLGVTIKTQGLDQRLNARAVILMRQMLKRVLDRAKAQRQEVAEVLDQFAAVYFLDSTILSLPATLREVFQGVGGNASCAAVKIQLLFEYLSGNIAHLAFASARETDQAYQGHLPHVQPGSLLIQDLGFFNLRTLQAVVDQLACFLTRWQQGVHVYLASVPDHTLDMLSFLRQQGPGVAEYAVLVGKTAKLPCRMVCVRLPADVVAQRRRRAKADAKRRGKPISKRKLDLLAWNVFLTNVPAAQLSLRQILVCYSLRWQVELIFKLWKSQAALKHIASVRKERVLCMLHAKMVGIVLSHFLIAPLRFLLRQQDVEISPVKARQTFQDRAKSLSLALGTHAANLRAEIEELCQRIITFDHKTKRKKHLSTFNKLLAADTLDIYQLYPLA
jgi:hypothetical protein